MTAALHLGFLPLVDAGPLIVADAMGFAEEEGLALHLHAAPGRAALRDMLAQDAVTAALILAPVPVAQALGLGGSPVRFKVLLVLNANGNAIGVSQALLGQIRDGGHDFAFRDARATGMSLLATTADRLRIGVPFAFSMHHKLVRYWLDGPGSPLPDGLQIMTVPPPRMADALAADEIEAFAWVNRAGHLRWIWGQAR